jgi:hypothetical protein
MRFLEGFTPAGYRDTSDGTVLRLAFPADDGHSTVSDAGTADAELAGHRTGGCHRGHRESGPWRGGNGLRGSGCKERGTGAPGPHPLARRRRQRVPTVERLRALADAAVAGDLDATRLRAMPVEDALAHLRTLPGIGPFSAELILIRGSGHPDVFPRHERRLHASMAEAYGLGDTDASDVRRLAGIGDHWAPYRSWVALRLRTRREEKAGPAARGRPVR